MKQDEQYRSQYGVIATVLYVGHGYVIYKTGDVSYSLSEKLFREVYSTLMKPRIKKTVWLNVYSGNEPVKSGTWFVDKGDCDYYRYTKRIACVQVEIDCEEGEGL